jgi:hypothetical protein
MKKIKIFGIVAAVLLILTAIMPLSLAASDGRDNDCDEEVDESGNGSGVPPCTSPKIWWGQFWDWVISRIDD